MFILKYFERELCISNRMLINIFFRTKMHTKKYIDNIFKKAIYEVPLKQLTAEDIQNYKL